MFHVSYFCVLFLCLGLVFCQIEFTVHPEDQVVVYGQDVYLNCHARNASSGGEEGLLYEWEHNNGPRQEKSSIYVNHTLRLPNLQMTDLGNYTCVVYESADNYTESYRSQSADIFHAFITAFESSPDSMTVDEDDIISFECITGLSAPPAELSWERNGQPFYGGNQYNATYGGDSTISLRRQYSMKLILVAKPYLDGTYNCVARNPLLKNNVRSLNAVLKTRELESAPYLMDELLQTEILAPASIPLLIHCPVTGKPTVTIRWYKDWEVVTSTTEIYVLANGSLSVPQTDADDEAVYYCDGTNEYGRLSSPNITVTVARIEIDFVHQPSNVFTIAGQPAWMYCTPPFSVPTANVTWYKDTVPLVPRTGDQAVSVVRSNAGSWNLHFAQVQKIDEGEYFCVGTNDFSFPKSRTSRTAVLEVGGAPVFIEPPTGLTVVKDSLATLRCFVEGDPFPDVTWLFEERILVQSAKVTFRQQNQELMITNLNKGGEGTYTCQAQNRYGLIQTRVYVKVLVPPVVLEPVGHRTASAGRSVTIPCVVYSDPSPVFTWFKDTVAVSVGVGRFSQHPEGLYINPVEPEDDGHYVCEVSNIAGSVITNGTLTVLVLPHFEVIPEDQIAVIGDNVTLTCVASGYPQPNITWLYNGTTLFPTGVYMSLNHENLFLSQVDWRHVGHYTCLAQNKEGAANTTASLRLWVPPAVQKIDGVPVLYESEELFLTCQVAGLPTPQIRWEHNREAVTPTQNGRVTLPGNASINIKFVTASDSGIYTCVATSESGIARRDIQVLIIEPPTTPALLQASGMSSESVLLTYSLAQIKPQTPVDRVSVYYRLKTELTFYEYGEEIPGAFTQYEVMGLSPASEYLFKITAVNGAGPSDFSNILAARTFDSGPSEPRNLQTTSVDATSVTLEWEIPATTNGEIRKYEIRFKPKDFVTVYNSTVIDSLSAPTESTVVADLFPYTMYIFMVRGATTERDAIMWGNWSSIVSVRTSQSAPSAAPDNVIATALSHDTVQVFWEPVPYTKQNGPIQKYVITYWLLGNLTVPAGEVVSHDLGLRTNVTGLKAWTWYSFVAEAENIAGRGVKSTPVTVRTLPLAPSGAPLNVSAVALSPYTVAVTWKPPPVSHWNSILAGYLVEYRPIMENKTIYSATTYKTSIEISDLDPYTEYGIQVAAYTYLVTPGVGPFSANISEFTLEAAPGPVSTVTSSEITSSSIKLSWQPPAAANGIVRNYLVLYFAVGPYAEVTTVSTTTTAVQTSRSLQNGTLSPNIGPGDRNHSIAKRDVPNTQSTVSPASSQDGGNFITGETGSETVQNSQTGISQTDLNTLEEVCGALSAISEQTLVLLNKFYNLSKGGERTQGLTDVVSNLKLQVTDTLISSLQERNMTFEHACLDIFNITLSLSDIVVHNITTDLPEVTLTGLEPATMYNISIRAYTAAGYGEAFSITLSTLSLPSTPKPTERPPPTLPRPKPTLAAAPQKSDNSGIENLPAIIGGAVSGALVLLIVLIVAVCLYCRKRQDEEKASVISVSNMDDQSMYSNHEVERCRSGQMAAAAEDGTDTDSRLSGANIDVFAGTAHYHSSSSSSRSQGSVGASSHITGSNGRHRPHGQDSRIRLNPAGLDNPVFPNIEDAGGAATVKSNPAYVEDGDRSLESMSITMSFSTEGDLSSALSPDTTLKRKHKMRNEAAAAIARLRNSHLPSTLGISDTSSLISNDAEVIYNERTAL